MSGNCLELLVSKQVIVALNSAVGVKPGFLFVILFCNLSFISLFKITVFFYFQSDKSLLVQPVKLIDPHLVSSFFDNYKRVYLHCTTELENRSTWVAECSLSIEVTAELEANVTSIEHLQTEHVSISPGARTQHTFTEVSKY